MSIVSSYMVPHPPLIIKEVGKGNEKQIELTTNSYLDIAKEIGDLKPETNILYDNHDFGLDRQISRELNESNTELYINDKKYEY